MASPGTMCMHVLRITAVILGGNLLLIRLQHTNLSTHTRLGKYSFMVSGYTIRNYKYIILDLLALHCRLFSQFLESLEEVSPYLLRSHL